MSKKYSIGLSTRISINEYKQLLIKYGNYIDFVYFSVPISEAFQSRKNIYSDFSIEEATVFLRDVIDLFKSFNVKIELTLNTYNISNDDLDLAYSYLINKLERMPDAIVSNCTLFDRIQEVFPDVYNIVSFNSFIRNEKDLEYVPKEYDEIIMGSSVIRDFEFWKKVQNKGFKSRLLLNNGCSFNCGSCATAAKCIDIFQHNLKRTHINYLYALQSLYPSEVSQYIANNSNLHGYKISNRNCSYNYLENCLSGYIEGENKEKYGVEHFYYWARLGHFGKYKNSLDEGKIMDLKKEIWEEILSKYSMQ